MSRLEPFEEGRFLDILAPALAALPEDDQAYFAEVPRGSTLMTESISFQQVSPL
jgi:hypothetical protein